MQFLCFALLLFEIRYEHECFPMIIWGARLTKLEETAHLLPITPFSSPFTHLIFCFRLHYQISHKELSSSLDTKQLIRVIGGGPSSTQRTV